VDIKMDLKNRKQALVLDSSESGEGHNASSGDYGYEPLGFTNVRAFFTNQ
jgi:hypothetical protein